MTQPSATVETSTRADDGGATTIGERPEDPASQARRDRVRTGAVLAFYAVVAVALFFPSPAKLTTYVPGDGGDALLNFWIVRWVEHSTPHGWHALWNTNAFFPNHNTLAYSESLLPVALVHWVLAAVTRSQVLAFNLVYLAGWTLSGFCTYVLAKRYVRSDAAAIVAGLAYTIATPRLSHYGHFQLSAGWLIPVVLLAAVRLIERPGPWRGATFGALVALQGLASSYYGVTAAVAAAVVVVVLLAWARPWRTAGWRPLIGAGAAALAVAGVLAAPVAVHYRQLQRDPAFRRGPEPALAAHPGDFVAVPAANHLLADVPPFSGQIDDPGRTIENLLFPGAVALVLGAIGAVVVVRRRDTRFAETVAIVAAGAVLLVLSFGDTLHVAGAAIPMPFGLLRRHVPGFSGIRATSRFVAMPQLALAVLAAFGAQWLLHRVTRRGATLAALVAVSLVGAMIAESANRIQFARVPSMAVDTAVNHALARLPHGPVVELPAGSPSDGWPWAYIEAPRLALSTIDWDERVGGYSGFAPPEYDALAATLETFPSRASLTTMRRLGVRYVVLRTSVLARMPAVQQRDLERDGVARYSPAHARRVVDAVRRREVGTVTRYGDAYLVTLR